MRIHWKVLASFAVVAVLVVAIQAVVSGYAMRDTFLENLETDLTREARELAVTLDGTGTGIDGALSDPAALQAFARAIGGATDARVTVVAADGTVLADSEVGPATLDNHRDRPEVAAALAAGEGSERRFSATIGQEMLYVAVRTEQGEHPWSGGVVRVALPATTVDPLLRNVVTLPFLVGLILLAPIIAVGYLLSRSFTRPIERLRSMAVAVAEGDLSYRVGTRRRDELGELGRALNTMAGEFEHRVDSLAAEQELSAEILAAMEDGVLVIDSSGTVVRANHGAARILGVPLVSLEGRPLVHSARSFTALPVVERARRSDTPTTELLELPDGRSLWLQAVRLTAPTGDGGTVDFSPSAPSQASAPGAAATRGRSGGRRPPQGLVLLVFRDETARRRAEAQRRDLVANVSHELKTPLAGLSLLAATVQRTVRDDPEQAERFAARLTAEVGRLDDLVADLLVLSRLEETGETPGESQTVDLAVIARDVAAEVASQAEAMRQGVHVDAPEAVSVRGDPTQLATMIRNLVDNALRYNHPGGNVWIRVEAAPDVARLTVRDDGVGIRRDQQSRIFERFYRVDKARSRDTGGTGLGLSIVKHVAERHGGRVEVESALGVGSTFTVTLTR